MTREKIRVLIVEPMEGPYEKWIDNSLKSLQAEVGGWIQAVYPFEEEVAIICNEEGKLNGMPPNRALYDENGRLYDIIHGNFIIAGLAEDDFGSLTDEQIEQFTEYYRTPETPETSMNTARVPVETILRAMDAASMYYDDINSSEGHLVFHTEGAPVSFGSWKEVHEWLEGVTFDDPNVSDRVEEILHPERFINIYYDKAVSTDMDVQKRDADELY